MWSYQQINKTRACLNQTDTKLIIPIPSKQAQKALNNIKNL